ncbi:MAG: response regulator [Ferruginibacter sp.]|nr:response regulator [Ferruginibacter sp.]
MSTNKKISIFLVDDDALYLKLLEKDLSEKPDYLISTFATGERCLESLSEKPDIIVLDYFLNGIEKDVLNGLETLSMIKSEYPGIPVIMLSSQDKIEVAVNCMKLQAFEYIVKSETALARLNNAILTALHYKKMEKTLSWYMEKL